MKIIYYSCISWCKYRLLFDYYKNNLTDQWKHDHGRRLEINGCMYLKSENLWKLLSENQPIFQFDLNEGEIYLFSFVSCGFYFVEFVYFNEMWEEKLNIMIKVTIKGSSCFQVSTIRRNSVCNIVCFLYTCQLN